MARRDSGRRVSPLRPADELLLTRDRCDFVLSEVEFGRVTLDNATLSRVRKVRNEAHAELFDHGTRLANRYTPR